MLGVTVTSGGRLLMTRFEAPREYKTWKHFSLLIWLSVFNQATVDAL
jgi:hypothetical protein